MNWKKYFKTRPFFIKQLTVITPLVIALAVTLNEAKLEPEHRFYYDDRPADDYFHKAPLHLTTGAAVITSSALSLQFVNFKK